MCVAPVLWMHWVFAVGCDWSGLGSRLNQVAPYEVASMWASRKQEFLWFKLRQLSAPPALGYVVE